MIKNAKEMWMREVRDEEGSLQRLYWATPAMRENLRRFGQVVVIDSLAKSNRFGMPYVTITVVTESLTVRPISRKPQANSRPI